MRDEGSRKVAIQNAAEGVLKEMHEDAELERCIPYAEWWVRVENAKKGERVTVPRVEPYEHTKPAIEKASELWAREGRVMVAKTRSVATQEANTLESTCEPIVTYKDVPSVSSEKRMGGAVFYISGVVCVLVGCGVVGSGILRHRRQQSLASGKDE